MMLSPQLYPLRVLLLIATNTIERGGQAYGVTNGKQMHLEGFIINNMQSRNNFTAARQIQITIQHYK